eukprot:m.167014 g.167014  ORF g.167014 m.167014 type:complete len:424 (+) comp31451_c0_seq1:358-1629(+)
MADRFVCEVCKVKSFSRKQDCEVHQEFCSGTQKSSTFAAKQSSIQTPAQRSNTTVLSPQFHTECRAPKCVQRRDELLSQLSDLQLRQNGNVEEQLLEQVRQLEAEVGDLEAKAIAYIKPTAPPLEALGPLEAKRNVRVKLRTVEPVLKGSDGYNGTLYEITGPSKIVKLCTQINLSTLGTISPIGNVTLPPDIRKLANIPADAALFAFAYPLAGVSQLTNEELELFSTDNDLHTFVTIGGYVYFNIKGEVLQVNAIGIGPGLFFDGPHTLPMSELVELQKQGRMQPVSAGALRDTGAEYFCWLRPGEEQTLKGLPVPVPDGAFCYDYCGDGSNNRYFRVVSEELATKQDNAAKSLTIQAKKKPGEDEDSGALSTTPCHRCAVKNVNCVFLPCKHMACCKDCAEGIRMCPICERKIQMKIEVFC